MRDCDWDKAAAVRDEYERVKEVGRSTGAEVEAPTFAQFVDRYMAEDMAHLAPTTRRDRTRELRKNGPFASSFGHLELPEIGSAEIREWWNAVVVDRGRSTKTGRNYLDTLAALFGYARELKLIDANPVTEFREALRRRTRTQRGRYETDPVRNIHPIEDPVDIDRLVRAAEAEEEDAHLLVLLMLDAGLRLGEALGLRWESVLWGEHENDPRWALVVSASRPRGGEWGPTKSGRARLVAMSRRLRSALRDRYRARFASAPETDVLPRMDPNNFRHREWRRILRQAGTGHRRLKDLRDTYASQLLTCGVSLGYVSTQLGHADVAVTARHYARWLGSADNRVPMVPDLGDVPADFLPWLTDSPISPHLGRGPRPQSRTYLESWGG